MAPLFRLAYYSTNLLKQSRNRDQSGLRKLINEARSTNRARGVTGGLMFNRNYFGQVLEGDRSSVSDLFCRIAKDPRHRSVVVVEATQVQTRLFDRWSMGLAEKSETADRLNSEFGLKNGFDPVEMTSISFLTYVLEMVSAEDKLISVAIPIWEIA